MPLYEGRKIRNVNEMKRKRQGTRKTKRELSEDKRSKLEKTAND